MNSLRSWRRFTRSVPDLQVLMVSRRDAEATRAKAASLGLSFPIVMQNQWEISLKYAMFATPIGYLIDGQGQILTRCRRGSLLPSWHWLKNQHSRQRMLSRHRY